MRWGWSLVILCALSAPGLHPCFAEAGPGSAVGSVLGRWEQASAGLLGVGPLEHRRLFYLHHTEHSAHEISLLNEFRGPISAEDLAGRFDWSLERTGEVILLAGEPVDQVEKLFYSRVIVSLDAKTHLPHSIMFSGRDRSDQGEPLAVVLSPRVGEPGLLPPVPGARPLQYVSRNEDVPRRPSPVRVVEHITGKLLPRPDLPAEVEHALRVWETSALEIQSLHANVKRFTYETENLIERRAVGEFSYSNPPAIHCALKPAVLSSHEQSARRTSTGAAFELLPSPAETWEYSAGEIRLPHPPSPAVIVFHHAGGRPSSIQTASHENIRTNAGDEMIPPWDLLFHPSPKALADRFLIRLTGNEHLMTWSFIPRQRNDLGQFREMRVLLDNTTWLPFAVKLVNPRGDIETVYTFQYTQVERPQLSSRESQLLPIKPDAPKLQPAPTALHGFPESP